MIENQTYYWHILKNKFKRLNVGKLSYFDFWRVEKMWNILIFWQVLFQIKIFKDKEFSLEDKIRTRANPLVVTSRQSNPLVIKRQDFLKSLSFNPWKEKFIVRWIQICHQIKIIISLEIFTKQGKVVFKFLRLGLWFYYIWRKYHK